MDELKTAIIAARAAVNICFPKSLYPCVLPLLYLPLQAVSASTIKKCQHQQPDKPDPADTTLCNYYLKFGDEAINCSWQGN